MLYIYVKRKINEQPLPKGNNKNTQNVEHLGNPTKKKHERTPKPTPTEAQNFS